VSFEQPLLLVVDNVQDADETTIALLHYYGRQVPTQRTLLVCIARASDEAGADGDLAGLALDQGHAQLQRLGPLDETSLQRIAEDVLRQRGFEPSAQVLQSVGRLAQGNPLHATELALAIPAHDGRPAPDWLLGIADQARSAEESFEATATQRLAALSRGGRAVAAALAVAARPLAEHEILSVTQLAPAELASAVFELEGGRFLRRDGASLGIAHDSYALVARDALEEGEQTALHARLADVLAESAARNPAARIEVAQHLEQAGVLDGARAHALAAADFAGSVGAVSERAVALELVKRVSDRYDGDVSASLAECYLGLRAFDKLDTLCAEARAQVEQPPRIRGEFRYLEIAADHHTGRVSLSRVCAALEELLNDAGPGKFEHRDDAMTLLMRTADKVGAFGLVRAVARAQRRAASSLGPDLSAHALFASAYVFAKYHSPKRALPLLERARCQAEREQNWELEHSCRDGIGVVLRQLGRFAESIQQIRYGLALARKTLNPQAEATSLVNIAVAQMAMGQFAAAAHQLEASAHIDAKFPRWPYRVYRYGNQGVLALLTNRTNEARDAFERGLELATSIGLGPIAANCCAGLGLCAFNEGDCRTLACRCARLDELTGARAWPFADRWMIEAARGWNTLINQHDPDLAFASLAVACKDLSHRDVDHWLRLQMEIIRMKERVAGQIDAHARSHLAGLAAHYEAGGVLAAANERRGEPAVA